MSAKCVANLDEGCHGDTTLLSYRFMLQNHLGLHLAEPLEEIQKAAPYELSGNQRWMETR